MSIFECLESINSIRERMRQNPKDVRLWIASSQRIHELAVKLSDAAYELRKSLVQQDIENLVEDKL